VLYTKPYFELLVIFLFFGFSKNIFRNLSFIISYGKLLIILLFSACEKGPDCVDLLLEAGAKVDVQDNTENKHTPVHYAAAVNNDKAIDSLLKHKADVNIVNGAGDTPAHVALASGSVKAIKALIKHKCDIYHKNNKNTTVWELSQRKEIVSKDARVTFMTELDVVDPREFKLIRKFDNKIRLFVSF